MYKYRQANTKPAIIRECEKDYRQLMQSKKRVYQSDMISRLKKMQSEDPNDHWKLRKSMHNTKCQNNSITAGEFGEYFQNSNAPPHTPDFDYKAMEKLNKF